MSRGGGGSGRPIPGRQYVVQDDGDVADIGIAAYGKTGQGPRIWGANPQVSPTSKLPKGTKLIIPGEKPPVALKGREPDDVTCVIGGRVVPLMECKILRTMDTGTDAWHGKIAWTPGLDPKLDRVIRPFGYERAAVYLGNTLQVNGLLYVTSPSMTAEGTTMALTGYSFTADAIDSSVTPPYELSGVGLLDLALYYTRPMGISVKVDRSAVEGTKAQVNDKGQVLLSYGDFKKGYDPFGGKFARVTANEGEKIFDHLAKLAAQRGCLVSCTPEGDLLLLKANVGGKPVATLQEGDGIVTQWQATYDGRRRWHAYKIITAGVKGREKAPQRWGAPAAPAGRQLPSTITEMDDSVPRSRWITFRADDVTPGNIKHAARWKRNKTFADALTIPLPVSGWHTPEGALWEVNTMVVLKSAVLGMSKGVPMLIRSIEFELQGNRRTATLNLVPPQVFTGKDLGSIW